MKPKHRFYILTPSGSRAVLDEHRPVYAACETCGTQLKAYTFNELLAVGPGEVPPCPYCDKVKPYKPLSERSIKRNIRH